MYLKVREEGGVCWKGPWDKSKKESKVASECGVEVRPDRQLRGTVDNAVQER